MSKTDAEYMRAYRARRKAEAAEESFPVGTSAKINSMLARRIERIAELEAENGRLEAEVKHLKAELAKRPPVLGEPTWSNAPSFNSRPFTPAPKK